MMDENPDIQDKGNDWIKQNDRKDQKETQKRRKEKRTRPKRNHQNLRD
jgi:hypothetical protein